MSSDRPRFRPLHFQSHPARVDRSRRGSDHCSTELFSSSSPCLPSCCHTPSKAHSTRWQIAFVLWLVKLAGSASVLFRSRWRRPLLAYVALSGISSALVPIPNLSWDRMKIVCLLLVGSCSRKTCTGCSQVRTLVFLLILSGWRRPVFTALAIHRTEWECGSRTLSGSRRSIRRTFTRTTSFRSRRPPGS